MFSLFDFSSIFPGGLLTLFAHVRTAMLQRRVVMSMSVCSFVCLSVFLPARNSPVLYAQPSQNLSRMLAMVVSRSSFCTVAIRLCTSGFVDGVTFAH